MHRTNRNNAIRFENLEEALAKSPETYGHIDLLCGGWPCQDNSIAGKRAGHAGAKSGLWSEVRRILGILRPKWFIGENVPGLFTVNDGKDFWQVISDLDTLGYCVAWDVLDSQKFGVAQRRQRVFIVGSFGNIGAAKVLFEQESGGRNDKKIGERRERGLCLSARGSKPGRNDPTAETYDANVIQAGDYGKTQHGQFGNEGNLVCSTIREKQESAPSMRYNDPFVAYTINTSKRGCAGRIWEETHIAEANPDGKGAVARIPKGLDSLRGIVIGNAVTVNVAEWIGKRIMQSEKGD